MANRYFVATLPTAGPATLDGDLAHHLGRVLRVRAGDLVTLGDGAGGSAVATVRAVRPGAVEVDVATPTTKPAPVLRVTLAFAVPRAQRAEWLFEHGTEVGVHAFQPLWTQHTRPQGERAERWQRIVLAAAGQCDRDWVPVVQPAQELAAWLRTPLPVQRVVASIAGAPLAAGTFASGEVALLVGPEGGFAAEEHAAIADAGFVPWRLGQHILRTETAALIGAGLLLAR